LAHRHTKVVFNDIATRPVQNMPVCDLYAAVFPCQPWSTAGLGEGTDDRQGRGHISSTCTSTSAARPQSASSWETSRA
jgi:site-specific DNA-cytosine methylase